MSDQRIHKIYNIPYEDLLQKGQNDPHDDLHRGFFAPAGLLLTDPPYFIGKSKDWDAKKDRNKRLNELVENIFLPNVLADNAVLLIFNTFENVKYLEELITRKILELDDAGQYKIFPHLCWVKKNPRQNVSFLNHFEFILVLGKGTGRQRCAQFTTLENRYLTDIAPKSGNHLYPRTHVTQKPLDLIDTLISRYSLRKSDVVLDLFSGSNTIAFSAYGMGREYIASEADQVSYPTYLKNFRMSEMRIGRRLFQNRLNEGGYLQMPEVLDLDQAARKFESKPYDEIEATSKRHLAAVLRNRLTDLKAMQQDLLLPNETARQAFEDLLIQLRNLDDIKLQLSFLNKLFMPLLQTKRVVDRSGDKPKTSLEAKYLNGVYSHLLDHKLSDSQRGQLIAAYVYLTNNDPQLPLAETLRQNDEFEWHRLTTDILDRYTFTPNDYVFAKAIKMDIDAGVLEEREAPSRLRNFENLDLNLELIHRHFPKEIDIRFESSNLEDETLVFMRGTKANGEPRFEEEHKYISAEIINLVRDYYDQRSKLLIPFDYAKWFNQAGQKWTRNGATVRQTADYIIYLASLLNSLPSLESAIRTRYGVLNESDLKTAQGEAKSSKAALRAQIVNFYKIVTVAFQIYKELTNGLTDAPSVPVPVIDLNKEPFANQTPNLWRNRGIRKGHDYIQKTWIEDHETPDLLVPALIVRSLNLKVDDALNSNNPDRVIPALAYAISRHELTKSSRGGQFAELENIKQVLATQLPMVATYELNKLDQVKNGERRRHQLKFKRLKYEAGLSTKEIAEREKITTRAVNYILADEIQRPQIADLK